MKRIGLFKRMKLSKEATTILLNSINESTGIFGRCFEKPSYRRFKNGTIYVNVNTHFEEDSDFWKSVEDHKSDILNRFYSDTNAHDILDSLSDAGIGRVAVYLLYRENNNPTFGTIGEEITLDTLS